MYLCHLDNYYVNCLNGSLDKAYPHLIKAIKASPIKMLKPRRLGSIVKNVIISQITSDRKDKL